MRILFVRTELFLIILIKIILIKIILIKIILINYFNNPANTAINPFTGTCIIYIWYVPYNMYMILHCIIILPYMELLLYLRRLRLMMIVDGNTPYIRIKYCVCYSMYKYNHILRPTPTCNRNCLFERDFTQSMFAMNILYFLSAVFGVSSYCIILIIICGRLRTL